ncbi:hypothetical protein [Proteus mirabilis]|uniref:hypothetical protein n=1 Tax=Proteus mirabilis TaxID=584 RepID=UPI00367C298F
MGFKGTPAPWRHDEYHRTVKASNHKTVCIVPTTSNESNANAHLIAAAPELLESLRELVSAMERYEIDVGESAPVKHKEMMNKAKAAIAKALGQQ